MILSHIKRFIEDVLDKAVYFFTTVAVYILFAVLILISLLPVAVPIAAGYAVFVIMSSPVDPAVRIIVFALYSAGLFIYGGYLGLRGCSDVKEEIKAGLDMCESKVVSISDDVRRCGKVRRAVESKIYDAVMCIDAIRRKL